MEKNMDLDKAITQLAPYIGVVQVLQKYKQLFEAHAFPYTPIISENFTSPSQVQEFIFRRLVETYPLKLLRPSLIADAPDWISAFMDEAEDAMDDEEKAFADDCALLSGFILQTFYRQNYYVRDSISGKTIFICLADNIWRQNTIEDRLGCEATLWTIVLMILNYFLHLDNLLQYRQPLFKAYEIILVFVVNRLDSALQELDARQSEIPRLDQLGFEYRLTASPNVWGRARTAFSPASGGSGASCSNTPGSSGDMSSPYSTRAAAYRKKARKFVYDKRIHLLPRRLNKEEGKFLPGRYIYLR